MLVPVSTAPLTETSYIVLGLLEHGEPATPYDLKRFAQLSVFNFWAVPHTQLYTECARLAEAGLLGEHREETGRRRRLYRLTEAGRRALEQWRAEPTGELYEGRDPGTLKLFFGADPAPLADAQLQAHRRKLEAFEQLHVEAGPHMPEGMRLALEIGIGHEREYVRFWSQLSTARRTGDAPGARQANPPRSPARARAPRGRARTPRGRRAA
ncbi:MAG: PadR family transcriptional regulator [Actinobacteria bacterium]|nr:MAG: PadR family transcriptional regulator [Actinomycetota bacterium]